MLVSHAGTLLGGAEVCLLDVAPRLLEAGWDILVVVPSEGELSAALARAGVAVTVMELGSFRNRGETRSPILLVRVVGALVAGWRIGRLIRSRRIDVVHSNAAPVIAGALGARLAGVPHVWHVREILSGPLWRVLRWLIVHLSARQVCISQAVAQNMTGAGVVVVADGVDTDVFSPVGPEATAAGSDATAPGSDATDAPVEPKSRMDANPVVGMLARVHPFKGHELFLRAARLVVQTNPDARFVMLGGHLPAHEALRLNLESLREEFGLRDVAIFTPFAERRRLPKLLRQMTVVVMPSVWPEGGGLVVLEAMACGVPVVATALGGPTEVITDGVDGYLVSSADPREMAERIAELLDDPDLRSRIGAAARRRIAQAYSLDLNIERIAALYEELLKS